jgi:hypothetical protein
MLLALFVLTGCPGQRRPPPRTVEAPPPKTAPEPPVDVSPTTGVSEGTLESLLTDLATLESEADGILQSADRTGWERFVERIDGLQTRGFDLQESGDDETLDAIYGVLETLDALRDKAVRKQPR